MPDDAATYPVEKTGRDRFVLERRPPRPDHDPWRYQGLIVEDERAEDGSAVRMATVLLTGRECPWRCAMCDLWQYTTVADTPVGAIAAQVAAARAALDEGAQPIAGVKLYNAGSFFDARAVPEADYDGVAAALGGVSRVIVESHPTLVLRAGARVDRLLTALVRHCASDSEPARLEVAMGLETAHPEALDRLNKRFTVERFADAAAALHDRGAALRVFLLISPPFIPAGDQDGWLLRSLDVAFACGATAVSLVPTRPGNGAIEAIASAGSFQPPSLDDIERSIELALTHAAGRGRVFVDLWDLGKFSRCQRCRAIRRDRLHAMNLEQKGRPRARCGACDRE
jgi:radical SAM enzyme (TIGR01210 family)